MEEETLLPGLGMQRQQGGLLGALGNPQAMAYLAMIAKGLNPYSELNPQAMLAQAQRQQLAQQELMMRQNERKEAREWRQQEAERAQRNADRQFDASSLTAAAKGARDMGLTPGTDEYKTFITDWYRSNTDSKTDIPTQARQREEQANRLGMQPGSPAYQSYVLTGRLGRDEPLTATDRKAIYSAEDEVPRYESALRTIQEAKELTPKSYEGMGAGTAGYVESRFPLISGNKEKALATDRLSAILTEQGLQSLQKLFTGATTEKEMFAALSIASDMSRPVQNRMKALERLEQLTKDELEVKRRRFNQLRGGDYFRPGGGSSGAPAPGGGGGAADPLGIR